MTAVLEVRGLRKVHGDGEAEVVALHDVDLALGHGEFLAVTGPSGCGKSTLLNLLGGLDRPTAGEICLHGERVDDAGEGRRARLRTRLRCGAWAPTRCCRPASCAAGRCPTRRSCARCGRRPEKKGPLAGSFHLGGGGGRKREEASRP